MLRRTASTLIGEHQPHPSAVPDEEGRLCGEIDLVSACGWYREHARRGLPLLGSGCRSAEGTAWFGVAFLGTAGDPPSILEAIEHSVHGWPRSARPFHKRPAVQLTAIAGSLDQQVQDIEQGLGYAYRIAYTAYITYIG